LADPTIECTALDDGSASVSVRRWTPKTTALGSVVLLHGIQSHSGWYVNTCSRLADTGFHVLAPDRRGSGLNQENRGDAPSFRRLLDDIATTLQSAEPPRFLIGISWGGKLAVALQRRNPGLCDGLILVTPGLASQITLSWTHRIRVLFSRCFSPQSYFDIPLNNPVLFTNNIEFQRWIRDDPLALRMATARLLFESARLDVYNSLAIRHVVVPTLVLLAERDRIVDNAVVRRIVSQFPTADMTVREYAGASHTLEFERGGPPFLSDLIPWLQRVALKKAH
jgi:alpha-beta hydrolase superfamily lysophospholipase